MVIEPQAMAEMLYSIMGLSLAIPLYFVGKEICNRVCRK